MVFMQPQFIIDVIKYVIRESRSEDVNDELRAHGRSHQRHNAKDDLDLLMGKGELTGSLPVNCSLLSCGPNSISSRRTRG